MKKGYFYPLQQEDYLSILCSVVNHVTSRNVYNERNERVYITRSMSHTLYIATDKGLHCRNVLHSYVSVL